MFNYIEEGKLDIIGHFKNLIASGTIKLKENGDLELQGVNATEVPWYYVKGNLESQCHLWLAILWPTYGFIPSRCLKCWKVVVRLRSVDELLQLSELQKISKYFCKCGTEVRDFVEANYGGYFYFDSMEEGLDGLENISNMVANEISLEIPVILKRGCTEYGVKFPNTNEWGEISEEHKKLEDMVVEKLSANMEVTPQTEDQIRHVKCNWIKFASNIGDMSYTKYTDGQLLNQPAMAYSRRQA